MLRSGNNIFLLSKGVNGLRSARYRLTNRLHGKLLWVSPLFRPLLWTTISEYRPFQFSV